MFDIGAEELLVVAVVAILVIGPKDMPLALRSVGRWVGKMRKVSSHFRTGLDAMVREAELEDMEKKWKEQNAKVMREHPEGAPATQMEPTGAYPARQLSDQTPAGEGEKPGTDIPVSAEAGAQAKAEARAQDQARAAKRAAAQVAGDDPDAPAGTSDTVAPDAAREA